MDFLARSWNICDCYFGKYSTRKTTNTGERHRQLTEHDPPDCDVATRAAREDPHLRDDEMMKTLTMVAYRSTVCREMELRSYDQWV